MAVTRCPRCQIVILPEEAEGDTCPSCQASLAAATPAHRSLPAGQAHLGPSGRTPSSTSSPGANPGRREAGLLVPLLWTVLLAAVGFLAFTGYVAYSGARPFWLPDAFEGPPRSDAARLGSVLEGGLNWSMRVCGTVLILLGAGLAARRDVSSQALGGVTVVLAGAVLITQHWAAGVALALVGAAAAVGQGWRAPASNGKGERT